MYRVTVNSFRELPKDKQPPRNLWDKPHRLDEWFDDVFDRDKGTSQKYLEFDTEEVE